MATLAPVRTAARSSASNRVEAAVELHDGGPFLEEFPINAGQPVFEGDNGGQMGHQGNTRVFRPRAVGQVGDTGGHLAASSGMSPG